MALIDTLNFIEYNKSMEKILSIPSGFTIFGLEIKFYGITMALSYALALIICLVLCKKKHYNENLPYKLLLIAFPLAIIGGRLGYVIFDNRTWTLAEIINIRSGGLMLYGGVLLALVGIVIYAICKKQNPLKYMDLIAPCLILAQALGRWGNFFNQEAYGNLITNPSLQWFPFGVYIESPHFTTDAISQLAQAGMSGASGAWFYATFFYESAWCLLSFFAIYFVYKKTNQVGLSTAMYLVLYASERLLVEGIRTDSLYLGSTGIRISQLISIIMIACGMALLIYILIKQLKQIKATKLALEQKQAKEIYRDTSIQLKATNYEDVTKQYELGNKQTQAQQNKLLSDEVKPTKNKRVEKIINKNKQNKE